MSALSLEVESLVRNVEEMQRTNSPEAMGAVETTIRNMLSSTQFLPLFSSYLQDSLTRREILKTVNNPHAIFLVATSLKNAIGTPDGARMGDYIQYRKHAEWRS